MANEFSTGRDASFDIIDPESGVIRFEIKTRVEETPIYDDLASKGLDGITRRDAVPDGHRLVFGVDRKDGRLDTYFANREDRHFRGQKVPNVSVTRSVKERDGSISQFRYTDCTVKLTGGGTWAGNGIATQGLELMAARKIKIA